MLVQQKSGQQAQVQVFDLMSLQIINQRGLTFHHQTKSVSNRLISSIKRGKKKTATTTKFLMQWRIKRETDKSTKNILHKEGNQLCHVLWIPLNSLLDKYTYQTNALPCAIPSLHCLVILVLLQPYKNFHIQNWKTRTIFFIKTFKFDICRKHICPIIVSIIIKLCLIVVI